MSEAALALLQDDSDEGPAPESPSQQTIALLEGRRQVAAPPPVTAVEHAQKAANVFLQHPFTAGAGYLENALSGVAGGAGSLVEAVTGADPGTYSEKFAFEPFTEAGKQIADLGGEESARVGSWYDQLVGTGPLAQTLKERIPQFVGAAGTVAGAGEIARFASRGIPVRAAPTDPLGGFGADSASAAAASRINAAKNISPELLEDLRSQVRKGPLDTAAVDRQIDADALPVRMRLMEGQASKDPKVWSREFNAKGRDPEVAARFNEQNQQLIDNLDEFRREAAPQAVAHDPVQSGQNIVDAYKGIDKVATDEINAAYKVARDANGGDLPMDAKTFIANLDKVKNAKSRFLPSEIAAELDEYRSGAPMSFEQFEDFRTTLANAARKAKSSSDGNAAHAIGVVRDQLESMEPLGAAKKVKPLFDQARSLAKARFDKIKADPAYRAAVEDDVGAGESSPLADKFVQKYIVGAPRAHVERMLGNLANDDLAMETVRAAPFNYLKQKAGIDPYRNEGNFSQHGYNRALAELEPKLDLMAGEDLAEQARRLGRVAYDAKGEPAGSFPNRSNTFIAATAEMAKGLAERSANTMIGGNIVPVGTWAREKLNARTAAREQKERLRPAAGTRAKEKKP